MEGISDAIPQDARAGRRIRYRPLDCQAAAAADAAFTPAKLGGCVLWLRGDAGVATDRAGNVTKWQDQSGKGNDLDRIVNAGPVVVTGPNGRPVVQFDGRGYAYSSHDLGPKLTRHCTILLFAHWLSPTPADCRSVLASQTVDWKFGFQDGDDQSWIGNQWIYQRDWNLYGGGSSNADWHLHTGTLDDAAQRSANIASVQFWKDGLMLMDRPMKFDSSLSGPRQIALGGPTLAKCEIGEVAIFDRGLDPAELTAQWKYFSNRYKVTSPAYAVAGSPPANFHTNAAFPIAAGPFKPDWRSFAQYECPEWFRDAKFGIWAHWSPQCQPEQGDWYAQHIYEQGSRQYAYHVAHYGHPSMFGYKDICNQWKADKWNPEKMIRLYKSVGAKYFVALANHHDNFDCWDSTYRPWNSVNVGPKKDIVGTWAALARKHGLHFGVTVHSARAWEWFDAAQRSDTSGPLKGVPYDGILTKADGKGKWWDGLDPADLYGPHGADRTPAAREAYIHKWFCRTKQLVDKYQPDLLYFDDTTPPLGDAGMSVVAHFLNSSMAARGGKMDVVYNTKIYDLQPPAEVYKSAGQRLRRGPRRFDPALPLADRHLHRQLALLSRHHVSVGRERREGIGQRRQQERQSAAEYPRERGWEPRRR